MHEGSPDGPSTDQAERYLAAPGTDARALEIVTLSLVGDRISAITWFAGSGVFPQFGLPPLLQNPI